jgi:PAS domain S-box-containing protein
MFGCRLQELIGASYPSLLHPDQRSSGDERMRKLITGEIDHVSTERHFVRADGSEFWGYLSGRRQEDEQGRFVSLVGHIADITERWHAEQKLRTSEERFSSIMALSPDIISIINKEGKLIYNSPSAQRIHGYTEEELFDQNTIALIHPEDQQPVQSAFATLISSPLQGANVQYRYKNKDGSYSWMECSAVNQLDNPLINGVIAISRNIDDRKKLENEQLKLEQQLLHAQKLESLGVLAGGIAHDFNNILTAIIGNAELALMRLAPESPVLDNLHRIENAAARAADLARQMLAYSGKGHFVIEAIDLNRLIEEMGHMLEVSISKKAILRYNLCRPLPAVNVDATQIRQIIMNLVINASEAIGDRSGVVAITTGCMDCEEAYLTDAWLADQIHEGMYVYLEVADTGCGMDRETQGKIFDPFFTTKFTGRGLGMAAVMGIIRGHHGVIKVYSEPGKGSSFKVLLPAGERPAELFNCASVNDSWCGSGVVLLVDDEETVRAVGSEMLRELGFDVVTAKDGRDAVEKFRSRDDIALVLLDLTMPHTDGEQCFRELRQLDPDVKVIMSSGFSEYEVSQKFAGKGLAGFIQKPYKLSTLKDIIKTSTGVRS